MNKLQITDGKLSRVTLKVGAFLPAGNPVEWWAEKIAHPTRLSNPSCNHQSGAVLIVSLIMLLLLTLIGVTSMQTTSLEEKMAGNMRDRDLAFQAAESALYDGESWAKSHTFTCDAAHGRFKPQDKDCNAVTVETAQVWDSINWDETDSVAYTGVLSNLSSNPSYIIEELGAANCPSGPINSPPSGCTNYRITARATGGSTNAVVILQSIYSRG
jgi:type IV pilus assembly protein PilX